MMLTEPGGAMRDVLVPAGSAYARTQGLEHNVTCLDVVHRSRTHGNGRDRMNPPRP